MNTINLCGKIHEIRPQEKVTLHHRLYEYSHNSRHILCMLR